MKCLFTCRMECRFSGFTRTISWLSSLSSSGGHCSSATPRSLYEELRFELPNDQAIFEVSDSTASLFRCNSESRLIFAVFLFRSFVRTAAIAPNRRQISRSGANNESQQTGAHWSEARKELGLETGSRLERQEQKLWNRSSGTELLGTGDGIRSSMQLE